MPVYDPLNSDYSSKLLTAIGRKLYLNSELADVHFVFEANHDFERVPANKAHLMTGSDVFATMFNGSWKEMDKVKIGDVSAAAFKEFLQFFYLGQVKLTMENIAEVMNLGEMYNVAECLAVCNKFLKNNLNNDNICRHYGLAMLLNQKNLKKACETFIVLNAKTVLKSTDFLACDRKILAQILKLNWMSCTEIELFEACISWVKAASKQNVLTKEIVQAHLGDLFHEIRFGSMSLQAFAALIPTYGKSFSFDEQQEIIQMIADPTFQPTIFDGNRVERCKSLKPWHADDDIICRRLISQYHLSKPYKIKGVETTTFSTNETLLLRGFVYSRVWKNIGDQYYEFENDVPTNITVVEVSHPNNEAILYNLNESLKSMKNTHIAVTEPVLIRPGFTYGIRLKQTPSESCCTGAIMKSTVELESGIAIQFHRNSVIEKDPRVMRGLIYKLIFLPV